MTKVYLARTVSGRDRGEPPPRGTEAAFLSFSISTFNKANLDQKDLRAISDILMTYREGASGCSMGPRVLSSLTFKRGIRLFHLNRPDSLQLAWCLS